MDKTTHDVPRHAGNSQAGFTLIETLVAIVILVFGLMAVTNLMFVGATNNSVANQGTAATTAASQTLENLKRIPFSQLTDGGDLNSNQTGFFRLDNIDGVGTIQTRWRVASVTADTEVKFITVQAEGTGAMARARSRATFSTFRSCTAQNQGCP